MNGFAEFLRRVAGHGHGIKGEEVWILVSRQSRKSGGEGRDLFIAHQGAVEAGSAAVRHEIGDGVVDRVVRAEVIRAMVALDVERLGSPAQHDSALRILCRFRSGALVGLGLGGQSSKVFLDDRNGFRRFHVSHHGHHHVRWNVVLVKELSRVGG